MQASCTAGVCDTGSCYSGFANCDNNPANGCETNILMSVANCGACGVTCPSVQNGTTSCNGGLCGAFCITGFDYCGGACVDTSSSASNCGACGNVCGNGSSCVSGVCTAPAPACGNGVVEAGEQCDDGANNGTTLCGCQANCTFNPASTICQAASCSGSTFTAAAMCDGAGTCQSGAATICNAVNGTSTCSANHCVVQACNTGFRDCDGSFTNGCETNIFSDAINCGACGHVCANGLTCVGGACQ